MSHVAEHFDANGFCACECVDCMPVKGEQGCRCRPCACRVRV